MQKIEWDTTLLLMSVTTILSVITHFVGLSYGMKSILTLGIAIPTVLIALLAAVYSMILYYRCWKALPEPFRCTSPGRAVGFLFIPLYNIHWAFVSYQGLAKGQNNWAAKQGDSTICDVSKLSTIYAFFYITNYILLLKIPVLPAVVNVLALLVFYRLFRGYVANANRILEAPERQSKNDQAWFD